MFILCLFRFVRFGRLCLVICGCVGLAVSGLNIVGFGMIVVCLWCCACCVRVAVLWLWFLFVALGLCVA